MAADQGHAIKVVVNRTGLSPHVIRMWEKRYDAVTPRRTPTNRRLYSNADIKRLMLLRRATLAGHSIGHIAHLSNETLLELVAEDAVALPPLAAESGGPDRAIPSPEPHVQGCLDAIERLDATELEATLMRARVALSQPAFVDCLIVPLMEEIGGRWRDGSIRIMHEHLATAVVRTVIGDFQEKPFEAPGAAPCIVATTPAGQIHEIGALIAASTAASEGWQVIYLGPNLPAEDIAAAAHQKNARVVALSLVYPADDPHTEHELTKLRRYLEPDMALIVGGRASEGYHDTLAAIGALHVKDMPAFRVCLEALRSEPIMP